MAEGVVALDDGQAVQERRRRHRQVRPGVRRPEGEAISRPDEQERGAGRDREADGGPFRLEPRSPRDEKRENGDGKEDSERELRERAEADGAAGQERIGVGPCAQPAIEGEQRERQRRRDSHIGRGHSGMTEGRRKRGQHRPGQERHAAAVAQSPDDGADERQRQEDQVGHPGPGQVRHEVAAAVEDGMAAAVQVGGRRRRDVA